MFSVLQFDVFVLNRLWRPKVDIYLIQNRSNRIFSLLQMIISAQQCVLWIQVIQFSMRCFKPLVGLHRFLNTVQSAKLTTDPISHPIHMAAHL